MKPNLSRGLLLTMVLAVAGGAVAAGELTVAWPAADDDRTVGYRVFVGLQPGVYDRVLDVNEATRVTVDDLEDGVVHYFAVKGYDELGEESPSYSPELASLPRPRVDAVDPPAVMAGETAYVSLAGRNFDPQVQVRVTDPRLTLRSAVSGGVGRLILLLEVAPSDPAEGAAPVALEPGFFTLINPGRKAEEFFQAHPEIVDLNASGWVDDQDSDAVRAALGAHPGEEHYRLEADLDGDGTVSLGDLSRVTARLGSPAHQLPGTEPENVAGGIRD